jgi:hypothetical protein
VHEKYLPENSHAAGGAVEQMLIVDWTRWKAHLQPAGLGCFRTGFFVFGSRIRRGIWAKLRQGRALFGKIALGFAPAWSLGRARAFCGRNSAFG